MKPEDLEIVPRRRRAFRVGDVVTIVLALAVALLVSDSRAARRDADARSAAATEQRAEQLQQTKDLSRRVDDLNGQLGAAQVEIRRLTDLVVSLGGDPGVSLDSNGDGDQELGGASATPPVAPSSTGTGGAAQDPSSSGQNPSTPAPTRPSASSQAAPRPTPTRPAASPTPSPSQPSGVVGAVCTALPLVTAIPLVCQIGR